MGSYSPSPLPPAPPPAPDAADGAVRAARRMQLAQMMMGNGRASTFLGGPVAAPGSGLLSGGAPAAPTTRKPLLGG